MLVSSEERVILTDLGRIWIGRAKILFQARSLSSAAWWPFLTQDRFYCKFEFFTLLWTIFVDARSWRAETYHYEMIPESTYKIRLQIVPWLKVLRKVSPFRNSKIMSRTRKEQLNRGSLPILEELLLKTGSATVWSQIVSGSCARTYYKHPRRFSPSLAGFWTQKRHIPAGSWRSNL